MVSYSSVSMFSDIPSTSYNKFSVLASLNDTELDPVSNIMQEKVGKPPFLVADEKIRLKNYWVETRSISVHLLEPKSFHKILNAMRNAKKILLNNITTSKASLSSLTPS